LLQGASILTNARIGCNLPELLQGSFQVFDGLPGNDLGIGEVVGGFEGLTVLVKKAQESRFSRLGHHLIRSHRLTPEFVIGPEDVEARLVAGREDSNNSRTQASPTTAFACKPKRGATQFNIEVQHLGKQKKNCYPECLWENAIIISTGTKE
jgi:hypothetical protein